MIFFLSYVHKIEIKFLELKLYEISFKFKHLFITINLIIDNKSTNFTLNSFNSALFSVKASSSMPFF